MAVFSITLQDCNDVDLIAQCLAGFKCAVRVSCIFDTTVSGVGALWGTWYNSEWGGSGTNATILTLPYLIIHNCSSGKLVTHQTTYYNLQFFQLVRSAYIQSLARFTMLNVSSGFSEIKPKNLEAIKTLITIAFNDCNYLGESWYDVSEAIFIQL